MLELLNLYRADVQYIASLVLGLAVLRYGGGPERAVGAVLVGFVVMPAMAARLMGLDAVMFGNQAWLVVTLDSLATIAFIAIALKANRTYPLWVAGFQLVAMSAHLVRGMVDAVSPLAYAILAIGPSYGQLLLLLGGFTFHCFRVRRHGPYRGWRMVPSGQPWTGLADRRGPHA